MDFLLSENSKLEIINNDNLKTIEKLNEFTNTIEHSEDKINKKISNNIIHLQSLKNILNKNQILFETIINNLFVKN